MSFGKHDDVGMVDLGAVEKDGSAEHVQSIDRDQDDLLRLGKKPVLKRNFSFMSIVGFSCSVLITWEASMILFLTGLQNGGPAGLIYGFIIIWIGTLSVFSTLSELVSIAPTSGGQYHWVSMLAPPSISKFLSYITGWLTVGGWQAAVASAGFFSGTLIQGLIILTVPSYEPQAWHGVLLSWAVLLFVVLINAFVNSLLPKFERLVLVLHILGFFAILIPLVALGSHDNATDVFTVWQNGGGWNSQGISFVVGLLGNVFAFSGADGAFHMSEEIHNPSVVVPRSIVLSIMINGSLGFSMIIAVLFCMGNIEDALQTPTGFPFIEIFLQATKSVSGAAAMASIIAALAVSATVGLLASTSRMFWSFARDRGIPGWRTIETVNQKTLIPQWSIATSTIISCLLVMISFGSATAFNDIVSLSVSSLYSSYLICASLLLYRRLTGGIEVTASENSGGSVLRNTAGAKLVWGPWHFSGAFGIINNIIAVIYLTIILFFSFWPSVVPVTPANMNYACLVTGACIIFSSVWYLARGKHDWKGPVIQI